MKALILLVSLLSELESGSVDDLGPEHFAPIIRRMCETERFRGSAEERASRAQTGRYFTREEYASLQGNPLLGYFANRDFSWGESASFRWGGIEARHPSAKGISPTAWQAAMNQVASRQALKIDDHAPVTIEGGCVAAVIDPSPKEPVPGVLVEVRVRGPKGTLLFRGGIGKATVEDAMGAILEAVVRFARNGGKSLCP
jgi:hypothetical protein